MTAPRRYGVRMVGDQLDVVPGQSAFGCVARLARLNHLSHADLYSIFGLRVRRRDDLHHILAHSDRRQASLAAAMKLLKFEEWRPDTWHPFRGGPSQIGTETFRYCFECIRVGHHCHLHQLPWLGTCPWHGVRLRSGCPRCGGPITVSGDTGRPLLTCACGVDLLDERAAARLMRAPKGAAETVSRYLAWAREARTRYALVGAPDVPFSGDPARTLVEVPTGVIGVGSYPHNPGAPPSHCRVYREAAGTYSIAHASDGCRLKALSECGPQMLELPEFLVRSVRAVARELAAKLPSGSLTEREQLLFLGCPDADLSAFAGADRPTSGTVRCLPPMAVGPRRFLDLSSVHPLVSQTVWALEPTGADQAKDPMDVAVRRRVQRDLLCRGYAEGLRAILSRYVPALHELGRDRPHLTAAWILIRTQAPFSARVAFTRIDMRSNAADTLSAARRQRW